MFYQKATVGAFALWTTFNGAEAATSCTKNMASGDCLGFFYCVHGSLATTVTPCAQGTLFDESRGLCLLEADVTCGTTVTPTSTASAGTACSKNMPTSDCSGYQYCVHGSLSSTVTNCPAGTLFDVTTGLCDYESSVTCGNSTAATTGNSTVGSTCSRNVPFDDCSGYNYCIHGKVSSMTQDCPTGTLFEESTQLCLYAADVECNGTSTGSSSSSTSNTTCSKNMPTSDCKGYYYCVHGELSSSATACPAGTLFETSTQLCNYEADVTCDANATATPSAAGLPTCGNGFTGQVGALDCSGFYYCRYGKLDSANFLACAGNTLYDESVGICKWESDVICATDNSTSTSSTSNITANPACNNRNGLVAAPDCSGFYYCFYGDLLSNKVACPPGTLFDPQLGICNYESDVTCEFSNATLPSGTPSSGSGSTTSTNLMNKWFPDWFDTQNCAQDTTDGPPAWMQPSGFAAEYLFDTQAQCCTKWGHGLPSCGR